MAEFVNRWNDSGQSFRGLCHHFCITHTEAFHMAQFHGLSMDMKGRLANKYELLVFLKGVTYRQKLIEKYRKSLTDAAAKDPEVFSRRKARSKEIFYARDRLYRLDPLWIRAFLAQAKQAGKVRRH